MVVAPAGALEREKFLNTRLGRFGVANMPAVDAFDALLKSLSPGLGHSLRPSPRSALPEALQSQMRPLDLKLERPTVREVLDGLVKAHGAINWVYEREGGSRGGSRGLPTISLEGALWSRSGSSLRWQ